MFVSLLCTVILLMRHFGCGVRNEADGFPISEMGCECRGYSTTAYMYHALFYLRDNRMF